MPRREADHVSKVSAPWSIIGRDGDGEHSGAVITPLGIVYVYSADADGGEPGVTTARFVWKGRCHARLWERGFTRRGLATIAARFAREIAGTVAS